MTYHFKSIKYCFVPSCANSTISSPNKKFIPVPKTECTRRKWFSAVGLPRARSLKPVFCCEDHFDMTRDVERGSKFNLLYGMSNIMLKSGVVPHCALNKNTVTKNEGEKKREREMGCSESILVENDEGVMASKESVEIPLPVKERSPIKSSPNVAILTTDSVLPQELHIQLDGDNSSHLYDDNETRTCINPTAALEKNFQFIETYSQTLPMESIPQEAAQDITFIPWTDLNNTSVQATSTPPMYYLQTPISYKTLNPTPTKKISRNVRVFQKIPLQIMSPPKAHKLNVSSSQLQNENLQPFDTFQSIQQSPRPDSVNMKKQCFERTGQQIVDLKIGKNVSELPILCQACGFKTSDMSIMESHVVDVHSRRRYFCTQVNCLYSTSKENRIKIHMAVAHNKDKNSNPTINKRIPAIFQ